MNKNYSICFISFIFLFMFMLFNFFFFIYFLMNNLTIFLEWELISFNSVVIVMSILLDWMSLLFMMFVSLISSVVIYYSKSYMSSELNLMRFIILVLLFVFSMILLIISPNMISILLGWDGLGLISYCLVIYYQNLKSYNAGMLTALSNRIGDVLILMIISWMMNYGSWNYIFYLEFMKNDFSMKFIGVMVILAAMTKSAQIPFSSWLPAAMAAPTPVSSLVHSSTLVTAGVYLLIRFNLLLVDTFFLKMLLLFSSLTMFMAGISANYEFDLKKIIALSTLSQLGLMMSILSMGIPVLAFFHLLTHAMFKALLFMCAGVIIHMMNDMQDIRFMGGISLYIPLTCLCMNISNMALCGIPFLSGFYSKDLILEMMSFSNFNILIFFLYYVSTGLTMFYTIRLTMYLMINVNYGWLIRTLHANGASFFFICIYLHIGRGIYYESYNLKYTWMVGVIILFLLMGTTFMGYVLPWGQMSFWGATVITNLLSAIPYLGTLLVNWIWGGFAIDNATLTRFYTFHFLLPFIILMMVIIHLLFLHQTGSNNPLGLNSNLDKIPFHPFFTFKDMIGFIILLFFLIMLTLTNPNLLGDPDNFTPANPLVTPVHIQPEWYFLFAYAILRSIPNKLGGVIALVMSILILIILPFTHNKKIQGIQFYPINQLLFWTMVTTIILLTWIGARPVETPYILTGQILTIIYFSYYILNPIVSKFWDKLLFN